MEILFYLGISSIIAILIVARSSDRERSITIKDQNTIYPYLLPHA